MPTDLAFLGRLTAYPNETLMNDFFDLSLINPLSRLITPKS